MSAEHLSAGGQGGSANSSDKTILDSLIVIAGFGLCRAWIVFCLAVPLIQGRLYHTDWLYLAFGVVAALAVVFALRWRGDYTNRIRRILYWVVGVALAVSAMAIPLALTQQIGPLLLSGFAIAGTGAGALQVLWGERFAHYKVRFATIAAPSAAVATAVLVYLASFATNLAGYVVFPLLSFVLLVLIAHRSGVEASTLFRGRGATVDDPAREAGQRPLESDFKKLMFTIMIFSFLCRMFDAVPPSGPELFAGSGGSAVASLIFVGVAFLLLAVALGDRFNPSLTYRLSLPLMVAGLVAIALLFETHVAFSILLINIGYEFFDILAWILFTKASRRKDEQPLRIFGFGVAFMFSGMALGLIGGELLNETITSGDAHITVFALLSILGLVTVAFLVVPQETIERFTKAAIPSGDEGGRKEPDGALRAADGDMRADGSGIKPPGRLEENCALVSREYGLTPRESEVLLLLAYGRTLRIIARDLHIAQGTARTHIENIYRKLDVHKQQELIDMIEDYVPR